jgi:uncharacterized protein involved in exopolysaccharide biosynthesis
MKRFLSACALLVVLLSSMAYAQKTSDTPQADPRTSPAYSLLIQRKVKVQAELESLLMEYGADWPRAKTLQLEFDALRTEMKKMLEVSEPKLSRLTAGYGALILRRVSIDTEIQSLLLEVGSDWPGVKEKQRELELLDKEIQKIMN